MIPTINLPLTGLRIKTLMSQKGYTVNDIREKLGLAVPQGIYKWLNGETLPSIDNLVALAAVLDVSVNDILVIE